LRPDESAQVVSQAPDTLNGLLQRSSDFPAFGLRFLDRKERETFVPWPEVYQRAQAVAGRLVQLGIGPGERVALIYPTEPGFFDAFFGILLAGAVPAPLYPPVRLGRLGEYHERTAAMLRASSAKLVLVHGGVKRLLGETLALATVEKGALTLEELPTARPLAKEVKAEDLALVQFSSGTTVDPKPVGLSHRAILSQVRALNGHWPDADGVWNSGVSWLPLYHDMGLIGCVFTALARPSTMTLIGPEVFVTRPAIWLRALSRYQATISVAPNFAYGLCVDKIKDEDLVGVDLSHWSTALNGAEPVAPEVLRSFQTRFAKWGFRSEALSPVYGLSEATLAVTFSDLDQDFRTLRVERDILAKEGRYVADAKGYELASVGRPLGGMELQLRDAEGESLPEDRVGRVWVRGPWVMSGYLDRPEATAKAIQDGWLDTGDLGFLHQGELYLTGRAKDVVILRGRNYSPSDIEHALQDIPGLRRGCVVAVSHLPEGGEGEVLWLLAEHASGADPTSQADLPRACSEAVLAKTGLRVDRALVLQPGTLPRTSSGKLRRQEALRRQLAGTLNPPKKVTPLYMAGAYTRSAIARLRQSPAKKRSLD
jgi:acyl-CoA synthetase (AMP-forming)/AMP-acid ligase II